MTTRFIEDERERKLLLTFIEKHELPMTVSVLRGSKRTTRQNKLQRQWMIEIATQLDDRTPEEVRGECKLTHGVPILRNENAEFCKKYDEDIKPLPYELKVRLMMLPYDLAVTRLMTTKQHTRYLDAVHRHYSAQGIVLTDPGDLLAQADARAAR